MEATRKNIASNTKTLFFPEKKHLKNFTIPKRIPDKDVLKECSTQQRDYSEIKQLLSQCCLDMECNFENFWRIDKVEVVQNKHLEEDFIAKRAMLREEGRQNKETSCFLAVSKEEVSKICQGGLHVGHSKKELNIMQQLGNPLLGVYLFRYVDIALRYSSQHFFPVENIIIFRVLLGKVKKVQPPKGKKKVALDPTPNFDCHMSRINPSVKDSLQEQTIGSLVYFYEYNELSKPVKKPRQCLPYAVIKIKSVNQKMGTGCVVKSLKRTPKMLPKNVVIYQMLKNWRKACQLKRQNVKTNLDVDEEYGNKDSPWSSHALYKRLADVTSDDAEERERSQSKKKKKEWDI